MSIMSAHGQRISTKNTSRWNPTSMLFRLTSRLRQTYCSTTGKSSLHSSKSSMVKALPIETDPTRAIFQPGRKIHPEVPRGIAGVRASELRAAGPPGHPVQRTQKPIRAAEHGDAHAVQLFQVPAHQSQPLKANLHAPNGHTPP